MMMIGFLGLVTTMAISTTSFDVPPLTLACRVSGAESVVPALTADQICDRLTRQMSETLKRPVQATAADRAVDPAETVRINVRIEPRRGAVAVIETRREGKWLKSPELSVTAMDTPPNSTTIDQLGRDIADYLNYERIEPQS